MTPEQFYEAAWAQLNQAVKDVHNSNSKKTPEAGATPQREENHQSREAGQAHGLSEEEVMFWRNVLRERS